MDKLSVHHGQHNGISKPPVHHHHHGKGGGKGKGGGGSGGKGIKVVYISSPMKLTASAEEFRAVVQELTGRDSNVADHDAAGVPSSSSSSSYTSFGRAGASPTAATAAAGARALPPANPGAGWSTAESYAAGAGAVPPPFQQSMHDQTGSAGLVYDQGYW